MTAAGISAAIMRIAQHLLGNPPQTVGNKQMRQGIHNKLAASISTANDILHTNVKLVVDNENHCSVQFKRKEHINIRIWQRSDDVALLTHTFTLHPHFTVHQTWHEGISLIEEHSTYEQLIF